MFVNCFVLNVVGHEIGHYLTARHYNLEPEIDFEWNNLSDLGFELGGIPLASTSFDDPKDERVLANVVAAGPLFNFALCILFALLFVYCRNKEYLREVILIGFILSFASFLMNLIPIDGSDGSLLWELI